MWMGDECNREWPVYGRRGRSLAGGAEKRKRVSEGGGHRRTRSCWTVQGVGTPLAAILMRLILVLLLLWFVLSSAKLVLDLIGRLWISVVLDFLQVLLCIVGLFSVWQGRRRLLLLLCLGALFTLSLNVLLLLLWLSLISSSSPSSLLSLHSPYSYSFWSRYTPFCGAKFNSHTGAWEQFDSCLVSYSSVEGAIHGVHCVFSLLLSLLALLLLCRKKKPPPPPIPSLKSSHAPFIGYANCTYEDEGALPHSRPISSAAHSRSNVSSQQSHSIHDTSQRSDGSPTVTLPHQSYSRRVPPRHAARPRSSSTNRDADSSVVSEEKEMRMHSVISFDPKSSHLIQVHEMEDSDSECSPSEEIVEAGVIRGPGRSQFRPPPPPPVPQSESLFTSPYRPKSAFQMLEVRSEGGSLVGGHYHSVEELQLISLQPTIRGTPLLV